MSDPNTTRRHTAASTSQRVPVRKSHSSFGQAWLRLRISPLFWVSIVIIAFLLVLATFPWLFTQHTPDRCDLADSRAPAGGKYLLGADLQGCDIMANIAYGARASLTVGVVSSLGATAVGVIIGIVAAYFGGWVDAVLSRIADVFFAIPLILGAIVAMQVTVHRNVWTLSMILIFFGWTGTARIARSATLEVRTKEYISAARLLRVHNGRILITHIIPNIIAPIIVVTTIGIGGLIAAEASLSYLSIGLPPNIPSWGKAIADGQKVLKVNPGIMLWPSLALTLTVLAFICLGEAIRNAFGARKDSR